MKMYRRNSARKNVLKIASYLVPFSSRHFENVFPRTFSRIRFYSKPLILLEVNIRTS